MPPMTSLYFRACTIYKPFAFSHFHLQPDGGQGQQTVAGQARGKGGRIEGPIHSYYVRNMNATCAAKDCALCRDFYAAA